MRRGQPAPHRRTLFLTGASGVVGRALLKRLGDTNLICLTRRSSVSGANVTLVTGDVARPRLGLQSSLYRVIAGQIDGVIHSAALTQFNQPPEHLDLVNVDGTRHALELATAAGVPFYHLSTAFVRPEAEWTDGFNGYESSKRRAETLLEGARRVVVLRPSLIVGDSVTGEIAHFGGFYLMLRLFLKGYLPVIPADPDSYADFIAQDTVADAIAALVEDGVTSGEYWLTAGDRALRIHQLADVMVGYARAMGRAVDYPRFVTRDTFDRLIRPVFVPALPKLVRRTLDSVVDLLKYFNIRRPFPSSIPELERAGRVAAWPVAADVLRTSVEYCMASTASEREQGAA